jgi:hypothetical protein
VDLTGLDAGIRAGAKVSSWGVGAAVRRSCPPVGTDVTLDLVGICVGTGVGRPVLEHSAVGADVEESARPTPSISSAMTDTVDSKCL